MAARHRFEPDPEEMEPLYGSTGMQEQVEKPWNIFKDPPREAVSGSSVETKYLDLGVKIMKVLTIIFVFLIVLGCAMISKGTTLFMTSQIRKNVTRPYCNRDIDRNLQFVVSITEQERVSWIWMLIFAYCVPEFGTLFRSVRKCLFKSWVMPSFAEFLSLLITESAPAIGSGILIFLILPELDVVKGAMLTNAVCFIPGVVALFSRNAFNVNDNFKMTLDIISVAAQATSFVIWPLLEEKPVLYMIPVSVILISLGWWENFVSEESAIPFIRNIAKTKKEFQNKKYFLYIFIAPIKCFLFFVTCLVIFYVREDDVNFIFDNFSDAFKNHQINVTEVEPIYTSSISDAVGNGFFKPITTNFMTPIWVWIINFLATYMCFAFGKFSCRVMIQNISFALPVNLSVPFLISGLIAMCGSYLKDECAFNGTIPDYLFFIPPPLYFLDDFISNQHSYVWLIWLLSQAWITVHIWSPNCDKLANTEQLFTKPMYDAFLIDQSLAMIRRRHEAPRNLAPEKKEVEELDPDEIDNDRITRIYACGTMWHETSAEMIEFLKSIMRLDQDQHAHRIVRTYLQFNLDSYYELETHIFFDDAYVRTHQDDTDPHVNEYVELLVSTMDDAASAVHGTKVRVSPPKIYPAPYGGRLVWTLPGKTKVIAHLKDKKKIRAKKRWSQVMYMYYLLGYKLQSNEEFSNASKDMRALNTYILALDGDIDFKPDALHLLVDYMKKNKKLGAACGRIHPIGSGAMAWYQIFEYAVGHWFQKATEHVIGCVLCSPGCFSLFRGSALMDQSVMKKYTTTPTEATHYVQYDQGEDRWLCTLLLQRGYRVEYSAASDAYTHCPEGFNEFYNQRRRWMPSTMANIIDLLSDYQHTVKINDNISLLYVFYQGVLMGGTVLGPGTIFLMLIGAFVAAFGLDQWSSLFLNLAPIIIFVIVCATCSSDIQLFFAGIITAIYGLVMMAVFVGVMLQISADGWLAPSSLFFFCVAASFILAALMHPKEFYCLKYGIIYYVTVPSMYMLLVIYSVFNMNNVSWGTREVTVVPKPENQLQQPAGEKKEEVKKKSSDKIFRFLGSSPDDDEGAIEFSLNKLFKCMLCTYKSDDKDNEQLKLIQESIRDLAKKIDTVERNNFGADNFESRRKTLVNTTFIEGSRATRASVLQESSNSSLERSDDLEESLSEPSDDVMQNSWFYDGGLIRGEVRYLDKKEEIFWNELIEQYLEPIEDDKEKVGGLLRDLRDKMVSTFFMLNALFVLVVFLLTLEKDTLHINWPITPKVNFTYLTDKDEIQIYFEYLQLEPIGFVFLIFFALILVTQFIAMLVHRFGTYAQILVNTKLDLNLCETDIDKMTEEEIKSKDPLKIAREFQTLKGINDENEELPDEPPEKRKTQSNLMRPAGRRSIAPIFDLDRAFHTRVKMISDEPNDFDGNRRKSVAFINDRRTTLFRRASMAPTKRNTLLMNEPVFHHEPFQLEAHESEEDC